MAKKKNPVALPPCGLYRTGIPLEANSEEYPAGRLVMFHNHSNRGIPMLQQPRDNVHNCWDFHAYGQGIEDDDAFIEALVPLREQGMYYLREPLETPDGVFPKYTLVQLGYNVFAHPILFVANHLEEDNGFYFEESGYRFEELNVLQKLGPAYPIGYVEREEEEVEIDPETSGNFLQ